MSFSLALALASVVASGPVLAQPVADSAGQGSSGMIPQRGGPGEVTDTLRMPNEFSTVMEFSRAEGLAMASENGRYVFRGVMFDMWTGAEIRTIDELRLSVNTANLAALGVDLETASVYRYGAGAREVTVFLDPLCPHCQRLMDAIVADPGLAVDYTFLLLPVSYLGQPSVRATTNLTCHPDRDRATRALVEKDVPWMMSADQSRDCDGSGLMNNMSLAASLGVSGVPFLIGPEGRIARGNPGDIRAFLDGTG